MSEFVLTPETSAGWGLIIDPTSEDAANVQLDINNGTSYRALGTLGLDPPQIDPQFVSSRDTEGNPLVDNRYQNREITVGLRVYGASAGGLAGLLVDLQQKIGKINREGGTLKLSTPAELTIVFDLLTAQIAGIFDTFVAVNNRCEVELSFEAKPFGRGAAATSSDRNETTLPYLAFTETGIPGDVPALGKLVIDEDDADDQQFLVWGLESKDYSSSANATVFYEAEGRTTQGGSTTAAGASGASGAGSNVVRNTDLATDYLSILSTQATGGGAHLSHVGDFRVLARLYRPAGNTGAVSVALEWAEGDFRRWTRNTPVSYAADEREGAFTLADLGLVHLTKVAQGTQRWEGRVVAKSTVAGDELDVDCLFIVPTERYGEARRTFTVSSPTTLSGADEFDQSAGALSGKTARVGGTWAGAGDADDFTVDATNHWVERTANSDADVVTGRYVRLGSATPAGVSVQADVKADVAVGVISESRLGVFARYVDTSNWLMAVMRCDGPDAPVVRRFLSLYKRVAGSTTELASLQLAEGVDVDDYGWRTIRLTVDALGNAAVYEGAQGQPLGTAKLTVNDTVLATGGALDDGGFGIYDACTVGVGTNTRLLDNFVASTSSTTDAAIFASQSLELRHDRVIREDSGGAFWTPVSDYRGDYLLIPVAGHEGRTVRVFLKASRGIPESGTDGGIDNISARLTYTPRYLMVPDA
jgi:hypothetical protein